jgi:ABC-type amino acid transport substrate-binding protein
MLHPSFLWRALLLIVAGLAAAPQVRAQDERPTLARAADAGALRIGYRESSAPFSYLDDKGVPVGFTLDLCGHIVEAVRVRLKRAELRAELQSVTSQNRIPLTLNGTVDLECGSTTNNASRREQVEFGINHFYTGTRLLVKKGAAINSIDDLKGKSVATTTGTTNFQVLRKYNAEHNLGFDLLTGKDHTESMQLVDSGRAVAFGMDDILLYGLVANSKNPADWEVVGEALRVEPYAVMLRKNDPEFKALVDEVLVRLIRSGEFEKLYKKWFQSPIPPRGTTLNVPISEELRRQLQSPSDRPNF